MLPATHEVRAADLWARYRANRRSRRRVDVNELYVTAFAVVVLGAMTASVLMRVSWPLASCLGACSVFLTWAPWCGAIMTGLTASFIATLLGPVSANPALCFWLLTSPTTRTGLLRPIITRIAAGALGFGAAAGGISLAFTGGSPWWIGSFSALATTVALLAVTWQADDDTRRASRHLVAATSAATIAVGLAMLAAAFGIAAPPFGAEAFAVIGLGGAVWAWRRASRRSSDIPVQLLAARAALNTSLRGAVTSGDSWLLFDILTTRLLPSSRVSARLRSSTRGAWAVAMSEAQRVAFRSPKVLLGLPIPLAVLGAATAFNLASVGNVLTCLALAVAMSPVLTTLRVLHRSPGLTRCFPQDARRLRLAASTAALLVSALWAGFGGLVVLAVGPLSPLDAWATATCIALGGFAGAARWTGGSAPDFSAGYVMTDAGPVPIGALFGLTRGPDLAIVAVAPLSAGAPAAVAVLVAALAAYYAIWRG